MAVLDGPLDAVIRNDLDGLLLIPGRPPCLRCSGKVVEAGTRRLDAGSILELLCEVAPEGVPPSACIGSCWKFVYRRRRVDFQFSAGLTLQGWSAACSPRVRVFRPGAAAARPQRSAIAAGLGGRLVEATRTQELGRRRFPRIPVRTEIQVTVDLTTFSAQISDLSEGGAFVETASPPAAGTELDFEFRLPGDGWPIEGRARVAWREPMVGMGIEFLAPPQARPAPRTSRCATC
ncbi:MAG: PilZ domain-containing protein [Myxococcales bacterium]|nr:PilZ domain-containing protein [Myxococcales bacterium]